MQPWHELNVTNQPTNQPPIHPPTTQWRHLVQLTWLDSLWVGLKIKLFYKNVCLQKITFFLLNSLSQDTNKQVHKTLKTVNSPHFFKVEPTTSLNIQLNLNAKRAKIKQIHPQLFYLQCRLWRSPRMRCRQSLRWRSDFVSVWGRLSRSSLNNLFPARRMCFRYSAEFGIPTATLAQQIIPRRLLNSMPRRSMHNDHIAIPAHFLDLSKYCRPLVSFECCADVSLLQSV